MKITLIGGGGLRAPLFVDCALRRAKSIGLTEIALVDIDQEQLALIEPICQQLVLRSGTSLKVKAYANVDAALTDAKFVVTTLRPGKMAGRIADEDIAMRHGVLGQETTGVGGFAMALRSIPTIINYAEKMRQICPDAWLINFTNPAGLVAQALQSAGYEKVIGICDSANGAQTAAARFLDVPTQAVEAELFGLNHLSFSRATMHEGRDVLPEMLADKSFLSTTAMSVFSPELVERRQMWINEYLWYFWSIDEAISAQNRKGGRGKEIQILNEKYLPLLINAPLDELLHTYEAYEAERSGSYMASARPSDAAAMAQPPEGEGYAGVALDVIGALMGGPSIRTGLNVPNRGAMPDMADDDVVEVSCIISKDRIDPVPVEPMPEMVRNLVWTIKAYERTAVRAIAEKDRALAADALCLHPLIRSYDLSSRLVNDLLAAHEEFTGVWK